MKPHEIIRRLSSAEVAALVVDACRDDSIPDKIAGGVLTYQNIPLRRFARLPEETRRAYVRRTLRDKRASDLALYVLSAALTRGQPAMIGTFLEAVGLPHDGPNLSVEGEDQAERRRRRSLFRPPGSRRRAVPACLRRATRRPLGLARGTPRGGPATLARGPLDGVTLRRLRDPRSRPPRS